MPKPNHFWVTHPSINTTLLRIARPRSGDLSLKLTANMCFFLPVCSLHNIEFYGNIGNLLKRREELTIIVMKTLIR